MKFLTRRCFVKEERIKYFNGIVTKQSGMKEQIPTLGEFFSFFIFCELDLRWPLLRYLCRPFCRDANPEICHGIETF
jgi:hypothetical protein